MFKDNFRYFILAVGLFCFMTLMANANVFSIAVVCMATNSSTTKLTSFPPLDYTQNDLTIINWALALGLALSTIPFTEIYSKFGSKYPLFGACILTTIATALLPSAAEYDYRIFLFLRFFQGIGFAANFAAIGYLTSRWSTIQQSGWFISLITLYAPLSTGISYLITVPICKTTFGWPMVFYAHAIAGLVGALIWLVFYEDQPKQSKYVFFNELQKLEKGRSKQELETREPVPYSLFLKDPVIWVLWFNGAMEVFVTNYLATYSPVYFRFALGYSEEATSIFSAVGRCMQIPTRLLAGGFSLYAICGNMKIRILIFNSIALIGGGISCFLMGVTPSSYPFFAVFFYAMVNFATGVSSCGFAQSAVIYSRQHSHFVLSVILFFKCVNMFVGPALNKYLVPDLESQEQWNVIFYGVGLVMCLSGFTFLFYHGTDTAEYLHNQKKITITFPADSSKPASTLTSTTLKASSV